MKLGQLSDMNPGRDTPDITPLIDIVFILLIFFVVTTTFVHEVGIDVDRPEAKTGTAQPHAVIRVAISERGELTIDAQPTNTWRLEAEVHDRLTSEPDASVLLVADRSVPAQRLVELMDACRRGGAARIAMAVEPSR